MKECRNLLICLTLWLLLSDFIISFGKADDYHSHSRPDDFEDNSTLNDVTINSNLTEPITNKIVNKSDTLSSGSKPGVNKTNDASNRSRGLDTIGAAQSGKVNVINHLSSDPPLQSEHKQRHENDGKLHKKETNMRVDAEYNTKILKNEFIVSFKSFYNETIRHNLIASCLKDIKREDWNVILRDNYFASMPSDFDVIRTSEDQEWEIVHKLKNHQNVKYVNPHKRISRTLKYFELEEESDEDEGYNNNCLDPPCERKDPDAKQGVDMQIPVTTKRSLSFGGAFWLSPVRHKNRKLLKSTSSSSQVTSALGTKSLWDKGFSGKGVKVAIFDTGLASKHPHFKEENIVDRTDWTNERTLEDGLGHGTFVTGVIASSKDCPGLAPDVDLYIFKVFTSRQVSYTSWFLDAFNYAIMKKVDVLNLSIGGPDFMDRPFVDKVWELTANKIVMISAIGNDGPLYGTLNNPADQMDVIGVGGIGFDDKLAKFSSRGMTAWELPGGYGRVKPDIVTYGSSVRGSALHGGCKILSGTSVASPVVTGAISLLLSTVSEERSHLINPASVKQALLASAQRMPDTNMFEQGAGRLDLLGAYEVLQTYVPKVTLYPSYIDFTDCPYMWPYCSQPLYYGGMPIVINITILNGMGLTGIVKDKITWQPVISENGQRIEVSVKTSSNIWPWFGYMAVYIGVSKEGENWEGVAVGQISLTVESPPGPGEQEPRVYTVALPIKVKIIPTPPRKQRILWDQYHNLRYPPGYFPKDNLAIKSDPLDWNNDHLHTNFRDAYHFLRANGYFVEVLGAPYSCFDAKQYGVLLIVDPEEEYFSEDIVKLKRDVESEGLSVVIFADWYNSTVMRKIKFYDENTKQWWTPATGGANIPALNSLLSSWRIAFGDVVYDGDFKIGPHEVYYASGTSIIQFPSNGFLVTVDQLKDQGLEIESGSKVNHQDVPVLGWYQVKLEKEKSDADKDEDSSRLEFIDNFNVSGKAKKATEEQSMGDNRKVRHVRQKADSKGILDFLPGRLAIYGDSNCLDGSHMKKDCFWLLLALLEYATMGTVKSDLESRKSSLKLNSTSLPQRMEGNQLYKYSKVLKSPGLPTCPHLSWLPAQPINSSALLFEVAKHLSTHYKSDYDSLVNMRRAVAMNNLRPDDQSADELWDGSHLFASADINFLLTLSFVGILIVLMFFWKLRHLRLFGRGKTRERPRFKYFT